MTDVPYRLERLGVLMRPDPAAPLEAEGVLNPASGRTKDGTLPAYPWEDLKIGAGPPPVRVPEGWLLIHHGVSGRLAEGWRPQRHARYAAGAMILDPADPGRVLARTQEPLLAPDVAEERHGTVPNVVFPTAIEEIDGQRFVFYGMADSTIGVARLLQEGPP